MTYEGESRLRHNRWHALGAVLSEQEFVRRSSTSSEESQERIATICQAYTKQSSRLAYAMGVTDASLVFSFLENTKTINTRGEKPLMRMALMQQHGHHRSRRQLFPQAA